MLVSCFLMSFGQIVFSDVIWVDCIFLYHLGSLYFTISFGQLLFPECHLGGVFFWCHLRLQLSEWNLKLLVLSEFHLFSTYVIWCNSSSIIWSSSSCVIWSSLSCLNVIWVLWTVQEHSQKKKTLSKSMEHNRHKRVWIHVARQLQIMVRRQSSLHASSRQ